jgi:hypothetical protein
MAEKKASNANLHKANKEKKDEFYTQLIDIEKELKHYKEQFRGKVVYCNCDDPFESNFFKYFTLNFNALGLKQLIATSYKPSPIANTQLSLFGDSVTLPPIKGRPKINANKFIINEVGDLNGDGAYDLKDIAEQLKANKNNEWAPLEGDGDFRSPESVELLKQADIVVTNPPFSLFREYIAQLIECNKKFLIIGNVNTITYKECFKLIKDNRMWLGASIHSGDREFQVPEDYPLEAAGFRVDEQGNKYIRVKGVRWFTNLDYDERHQELVLYKRYTPAEYPTYDNYDAIEIGKEKKNGKWEGCTELIPMDYDGVMGVPITFLDKYNPSQFEILGMSASAGYDKDIVGIPFQGQKDARPLVKGKNTYARVLIKNKKPQK